MSMHSPPKAIVLDRTFALAREDTLDMIAELQYASKVVPMEDGVWRLTLVNVHQGTAALTVACLYATRDFSYRFMRCQGG